MQNLPLTPDKQYAVKALIERAAHARGLSKMDVYNICGTKIRFLSANSPPLSRRLAHSCIRRMGLSWQEVLDFGIRVDDLETKLEIYRQQKGGGREAYTMTVLEIASYISHYLYTFGLRPRMVYESDMSMQSTMVTIQIRDRTDRLFFLEFIERQDLECAVRGFESDGPVTYVITPISNKLFDTVEKILYPNGQSQAPSFDSAPDPFTVPEDLQQHEQLH